MRDWDRCNIWILKQRLYSRCCMQLIRPGPSGSSTRTGDHTGTIVTAGEMLWGWGGGVNGDQWKTNSSAAWDPLEVTNEWLKVFFPPSCPHIQWQWWDEAETTLCVHPNMVHHESPINPHHNHQNKSDGKSANTPISAPSFNKLSSLNILTFAETSLPSLMG